MSDDRDRSVFGGARSPSPLNDPFPRARSHGLTGPPRGTVVAQAPKSDKRKAPVRAKVREISVIGTFQNQWSSAAEAEAMAKDRWEPTSDDFAAVAGDSIRVDSWKGLLQVILVKGDAESEAGSIGRINIFTHANPTLIALAGHVTPTNTGADVTLTTASAISEDTLDKLDSGITINVVSKNKKLASKKFDMDDVRKRFAPDAVLVIYACHGAVDGAFVQRIANTFGVKVRAFRAVIGYFPSYDEADPSTKKKARVTNRRRMGVGYDSKEKVTDFHDLDKNATDRSPKPLARAGSTNDDDDE